MSLDVQLVKQLRDQTNIGFGDCKKALTKANGDIELAKKYLKEMGILSAAKRENREAHDGRIFVSIEQNKALLLDLACETDFVARTDDFKKTGQEIADKALEIGYSNFEKESKDKLIELGDKVKENVQIRSYKELSKKDNELFESYIHGEGRIGVIVQMSIDKKELLDNSQIKELAFNCALHIAAFNPLFANVQAVSNEYVQEQKEIFTKQAEKLDKPDHVLKGIVEGKLSKLLKEVVMEEQNFVKNDKISVKKAINEVEKSLNCVIKITDFAYLAV